MLYLKEINLEDIDEEYRAFRSMPANENGFENKYHNCTKEELKDKIIPELINHSKGIGLPNGYVPSTYYFLWDDDKIVGLYKIRHYLNDFLRNGAGHIGAGILPEFRGKKYGEKGLKIAKEKCFEIIPEDEVYLSVHKDNPASLRMQLNNNAYIAGESDDEYLLRMKRDVEDVRFGYRDLERNDLKNIINKSVVTEEISNDLFHGKACLLKINSCKGPWVVNSPAGEVTILDNDYKFLMIAPENQNWWLTVMYDDNDNLIQSYFDITRVNCFETQVPYFIDMKLDVCIPANSIPVIIDEEDLKEVLDKGMITKEDYDNAYKTANRIIETFKKNPGAYYDFINSLYSRLNSKINEKIEKHSIK